MLASTNSRALKWLCLLIISCLLQCHPCASFDQVDSGNLQTALNHLAVQLRDGDLICRRGKGLFSAYCAGFSEDNRFSHAGLIKITSDGPMVIHAAAEDYPRPGKVIQTELADFVNNTVDWAVYRYDLSNEILGKAIVQIEHFRATDTPFDLKFDLTSNQAMYCTELVFRVINESAGRKMIHPGTVRGRTWYVSVEDCYAGGIARLVFDSRNQD